MSSAQSSYVKALRLKSGFTQADVAALIGISPSKVSRMENMHEIPSLRILLCYCIIFNARPRDIVPGLVDDAERVVKNNVPVCITRVTRLHDSVPCKEKRLKKLKALQ